MADVLRKRKLTERLGLPADALPGAGSWYPEDQVLSLLVDLVEELRPEHCVACGGGPASPCWRARWRRQDSAA